MKRVLPIVSGAILSAITLPFAMWLYMLLTHRVVASSFPTFFGSGPLAFKFYIRFFLASFDGLVILTMAAILGAWSVVMCRRRTFWQNVGCAFCSGVALFYFVWGLMDNYQLATSTATSMHDYFLPLVLFRAPLILWALALFLFALLSRRRTSSKPLFA